jgi:hypothetical protein
MNLILSDVEEIIMIVDVVEGGRDGQQGTINVNFPFFGLATWLTELAGSKKKDGYVVRERRRCHSGN